MIPRIELARLILDFQAAESVAIETMHPRDLDDLAAAKKRMVDAAHDIYDAEGLIAWDARGIFADLSN